MHALLVALKAAKLLTYLAIFYMPVAIATLATHPADLVWTIGATVIATLLAVSAFVNSYVNFESRFVQWFSHMTSSPRWFTIWLLIMVLWIPVRHLLTEHGLLNADSDFVVATVLWSCVPYMVENVLKSASAKAMALITELIIEIHAMHKRSEKRDDEMINLQQAAAERDAMLLGLLTKLLDAVEAPAIDEGG